MQNKYIPINEVDRDATRYAFEMMDKIDAEWDGLNERDKLLSAIKWAYLDAYEKGIKSVEIPF